VAAAEVLGVRAVVAGQDRIGAALWTTGALAWLALALALPVAIHRRRLTPTWWAASGNWLLPVVATQSLAVLAVALAGPGRVRPLLLVALSCRVIGLVMYAALIAAIGARVLCVNAQPARFTPDDWIIMGALAISALAATALLQADRMLWPAHALWQTPPSWPGDWPARRWRRWPFCTFAACCAITRLGATRRDGGRACSHLGCTAWRPGKSRSQWACSRSSWWHASPSGSLWALGR
jgi:hypothetical protein